MVFKWIICKANVGLLHHLKMYWQHIFEEEQNNITELDDDQISIYKLYTTVAEVYIPALAVWRNPLCFSQRSVSTVWRLEKWRTHLNHLDTPKVTPPGLGVSGKYELQRTKPYLSLSPFSTSRMTALMTLFPSMILWVQMIHRPSQSKSKGC